MALTGLLLIDDDPLISESLAFVLRDNFHITVLASREAVKKHLQTTALSPKIALVDLGLPPSPHSPNEGFAIVKELVKFNPDMKILILSGQNEKENVQHALTLGAVDFIPKPCDIELLKSRLEHQMMFINTENQQRPNLNVKKTSKKKDNCGLLGESPVMNNLRAQIKQFANSPFAILVQGDSGAGKELVAQCLHTQNQCEGACLTVNCAAFASELLDAQLFGHAKGAYTGAGAARSGFFEEANNGTLILDEIGEMPLNLQSKLLRVLENGEYYRLGETRVRKSTARIVAATNRDLREEVRSGQFRGDLYHRLTVLTISVPPLADRGEDSLILLKHFQKFYASMGVKFTLDAESTKVWKQYNFPGNVRELRNIVIRLGAKYPESTIAVHQLEAELETDVATKHLAFGDNDDSIEQQISEGTFSLDETLLEWEGKYIHAALKASQGNLSQAARTLGINRTTLYSKMQRLSKNNGSN